MFSFSGAVHAAGVKSGSTPHVQLPDLDAKYAGYTCQEVSHDYSEVFQAAVKTVF
jgi:hypothetical protein